MKRMIFHIPMKIDRNRASASQIRPMKMIEAFKECGYEVVVVEGYGKERKRQIKEIKSNILKGCLLYTSTGSFVQCHFFVCKASGTLFFRTSLFY